MKSMSLALALMITMLGTAQAAPTTKILSLCYVNWLDDQSPTAQAEWEKRARATGVKTVTVDPCAKQPETAGCQCKRDLRAAQWIP